MIEIEDVARLEMRPLARGRMRRRINLLGVGGIGSNLFRLLVRSYKNFMVRIYDPDHVELHNLNRTIMFSVRAAATKRSKVDAAREYAVLRGAADMVCLAVQDSVDREMNPEKGVTIDARDTMDPEKMVPGTWLKLAYDGGSNISFTWHPAIVASLVMDLTGDAHNPYEVVPSFYVPAQLLSIMAMRFLEFSSFADITKLRGGTHHVEIDEAVDAVSYAWEPEE